MTGKPVYKPEEIRFALNLMVQDLFNEEISQAFRERFNRELTDNQIRYLRNKYGKDPDYGSPLINRPANKKVKRRRAAIAAAAATSPISDTSAGPSKRSRREPSASSARLSLSPPNQPTEFSQFPSLGLEDDKSLLSVTPQLRTVAPQSQFSSIQSPPGSSYTLPLAQNAFVAGAASTQWQTQPRPAFTTSFTPINTQFGQRDANTLGQGTPQENNPMLSPGSLQHPHAQSLRGTGSTQQPAFGSFVNIKLPVTSPQQTAPPTEQCPAGPRQEPTKRQGYLGQLSWEEYVRTAGSAADQASFNQLLTRDVGARDEQLQLSQERSSFPGPIQNKHEENSQTSPYARSEANQDNDAGLDLTAIDPRLFTANYDHE
ncbi:hypothetical protein FLONG3_7499 [Fusarium longipes]|uniref:Uncharacterized protein n=1 Tax=Fusarium longipes TaxID=694270 RepID=A0A395SD30_9HYPO|nr:hypothetical protein FLONG3_7499 [Fusarium longipes]